jgi:hypothetical protein
MEDPLAASFRDEFPAKDLGRCVRGRIGRVAQEARIRCENVGASTCC